MIQLKPELRGTILDIGGGGEGVIGRLYGSQVVAIDNRQEELGEAPGGFEKILMDARQLTFKDASFDHVTFFYSLLFMDVQTQKQALAEAVRVLKQGGSLCIWDAEVPCAYPEPFLAELDIDINGEQLHTTFGIVSDIKNQTADTVAALCSMHGLRFKTQNTDNGQFELVFEKI